jgi:RNA polymerase sigma-70 factor (family 1)
VAAGDENAYTQLFHYYSPRLHLYLFRITKQEHIAREFVQETFLRLWVHRQTLTDMQQPESWLFRVAANLAYDHLRKEALRNNLQDKVYAAAAPKEDAAIDEQAEVNDLKRYIRKAVDGLPEKRKEVYLLSREEGLSHQEIAERLGISPNTVKVQISQALNFIREYLHNETGLSIAVLSFLISN